MKTNKSKCKSKTKAKQKQRRLKARENKRKQKVGKGKHKEGNLIVRISLARFLMTQPTGLRLQAASALIRDQTPTGAFNTRQDVPWTAEMHGLSRLPALCGIRIIMELHRRASASDHGRGPRINCHSRFPAYRISNCKPRASSPHLIRALPISDPSFILKLDVLDELSQNLFPSIDFFSVERLKFLCKFLGFV